MGTVRYTVINGEVVAEKRGGVRRLYVPDPLGSTVALLDNTQAKTDTFDYWPYGEESAHTGTIPTPFRFAGSFEYYRDSARLCLFQLAHLDVVRGRWLNTPANGGRDGGESKAFTIMTPPAFLFLPAQKDLKARCPCGCGEAKCRCSWPPPPTKCERKCISKAMAEIQSCYDDIQFCRQHHWNNEYCKKQGDICYETALKRLKECIASCKKTGKPGYITPPYIPPWVV